MRIRKKRSNDKRPAGDFFPATPLVVLEGQSKVVLYDCKKILCYAPMKILLAAGKERVRVDGKDLYCASFSCGTLTVRGRIDSVAFVDGEET